jgi:hypothetical protein
MEPAQPQVMPLADYFRLEAVRLPISEIYHRVWPAVRSPQSP